MLSAQEIQAAFHADRVVTLDVPNPHGPLGIEQLAESVARVMSSAPVSAGNTIERPLTLPLKTW